MVTPGDGVADPRAYPDRPLLAVSAAVFHEGRVLLARRAAPPLAGRWSLPGGLVEAGESLAEAVARELAEEVGIAADVVAFADIVEIVHRDAAGAAARHYVVLCFAARWRAGEARHGEGTDAVRWMSPASLDDLATAEGTAAAVARAAALVGAGAIHNQNSSS